MLLMYFLNLAALVYVPLQVTTVIMAKGTLRTVALLPLLMMVPLIGYTVYLLVRGSNLWPLMFFLACPWVDLYLGCILGMSIVQRRRRATRQ